MPESDVNILIISFIFPFIVACLSGYFSAKNVLWFMSLLQSKFCPPRKTFRFMWTTCYLLMSFSSFLVWREERNFYCVPLILYYIQLVINSTYCPLFFGLKKLDFALIDIVILDIVLGVCIFSFFQSSIIAGILLLPYFMWTLFNTVLNADFYRLQEGQKRDPVFFTTNYSPHHLYQSTKEAKIAKTKNTFYSTIPDAPQIKFNDQKEQPLRLRVGTTPDSLYVQ